MSDTSSAGNLLRRLLQLFGKLESRRNGQFAEVGLARLLQTYLQVDAVASGDVGGERLLNGSFESMKHWNLDRNTRR